MHNCLLQSRLDDFSSDEDDDDTLDEDESFKQNLKNGLKESNVGNGILLYISISTKFSKKNVRNWFVASSLSYEFYTKCSIRIPSRN